MFSIWTFENALGSRMQVYLKVYQVMFDDTWVPLSTRWDHTATQLDRQTRHWCNYSALSPLYEVDPQFVGSISLKPTDLNQVNTSYDSCPDW